VAAAETFLGKGAELGFGFGQDTGIVFGGGIFIDEFVPIISFEATSVAGYEASQAIVLPAGAVVTQALLEVSASAPPNATAAGGIASVRAAQGAPTSNSREIVIDFGVLRTVSSVSAPREVTRIDAWRGTQFDQSVVDDSNGSGLVTFTEVQTERLLVQLAQSVSPASFAGDARVTTTTPPADLTLLVGGAQAYARPGPVPEDFSEQVDVTAPLQTALDAATPGEDGNVTVPVVLRARVPGTLGLDLAQPIGYLRTHTVSFPGDTTPRSLDSEGALEVVLPLPDDAEGWVIHRVLATVVATDDGPQRVLPPVGPDGTDEAALVLDPDRRLLVCVPAERLAPFERLAGVRVSATPDAGGVELSGALLADADGAPGDPVPKGTFTPLTLDAADAPAFVTLALPQPLKVGAEAPLWFSLAATRGTAGIELAEPGGETVDATLRRVMPNGVVRPLSSPVGVRTDVLRLRLVGIPPELVPIDVVSTDLSGGDVVPEEVDPALAATGLVSLALGTPAARPGLALAITATAATAVTIGPVVVAYTDPASGGP
jgi:hypothetical protein